MVQNFTYLAFLCGICMLLVIGGVLLTNLSVYLQIIMIFIGLVGGIICFITLIRQLIVHNNLEENPPTIPEPTEITSNKKKRPQSHF
ncbi:MAG: sodium:potassium antiporter [Solibacillus sp.]